MTAFAELNWQHPDVWGIVVGRGLMTIETRNEQACDTWLAAHGYERIDLNFATGISPVVAWLGEYLNWEEQFGYVLRPESRGLDGLRDGFEFAAANLVIKLQSFEVAWTEDERWSSGFLSIISEYSLQQLALGRRFFAILPVADANSMLIGQTIEGLGIRFPFRFPGNLP